MDQSTHSDPPPPTPPPSAAERHLATVASQIRGQIVAARRTRAAAGAPGPSLEQEVRDRIDRDAAVLSVERRRQIAARIIRDTVGLGPLEDLLADPAVEEVMVNGSGSVYVERSGRIELTEARFCGDHEVRDAIERILAPLGRRVDELSPMADARLPDGSRVNVVIPPLAVDGPTISIRRFTAIRPSAEAMLAAGTLDERSLAILAAAIRDHRALLVCGGTGSGKTTLLNALSAFIAPDERVITIEDAAELRLQRRHLVRLESRPAGLEGRGEVTIRDLLRNALRMRPDRIVIGEVRGPEALDLLSALNTGHRGVLSTVHANSPLDAVRRLETLALMAGVGLSEQGIREQLARGIDLVAQLQRGDGGTRALVAIDAVVETATGVGTRPLYRRDGDLASPDAAPTL